MAVDWTKEQREAIELHDTDILVSAAAGSGKTAVLVERILQMVTRREHTVDVDRLLVVTFTKAAAGEMKDRLMASLEQKRAQEPENEHLQRQSSYIHNAQISTIDGFCGYVIRNYFHLIDLDPGYRVADEGELKLLKTDVARDVLDQAYEEEKDAFTEFVECYAPGKNDKALEERILELYESSQSHPWPKEWLHSCLEAYEIETPSDLASCSWMKEMWRLVHRKVEECLELTRASLEVAYQTDGPALYGAALESDQQFLEELRDCEDYDRFFAILGEQKWERLSGKKMPDVLEQLKNQVKNQRETVKNIIKDLKETFFYMTEKEVFETMKHCYPAIKCLVELTIRFMDQFTDKKRQKNMLDFSDMEHLALDILVKRKDGELERTQAAKELSERFEEILIDEYQDSNYVQEMLLESVSRHEKGFHNIFMVGDVKQSIYRFRLANPELFMEKYETYEKVETKGRRIDLHQNFRSREEVLEFANLVFSRMMSRDIGGVDYDRSAALYAGAEYPASDDVDTEILMLERDSEIMKEEGLRGSEKELEARMIGERIQKLTANGKVYDRSMDAYRPVKYSDCVILLRSISGYGETFSKVLQSMGIPSHVTTRTGYFGTLEVVTLLNYLHICDNPRQDIPFTAVLHSPIVGVSAEELAMLRLEFPEGCIYECSRRYLENGENPVLKKKLEDFFSVFYRMRSVVPYTPIHLLIQLILEQTGYGQYVRAMPAGEQRFANVSMLQEKARAYEKTSYRGLFNFIRYIEQLQKYQIDFGEVNIAGESEDTVRIMTIHKSKGLEFPVVFLAGMGKKFNLRDLNSAIIVHPDEGLAVDCVDPKRRVKTQTLFKQVVKRKLLIESLSEELRVLYVALTRAKEKLILTGTIDRLEKRREEYAFAAADKEKPLPCWIMEGGRDYWSWVLPALTGHEKRYHLRIVTPMELTADETQRQLNREISRQRLYHWDDQIVWDQKVRKICDERFDFQYPYAMQKEVPVKVTVSELKKAGYEEETVEELFFEPDVIPLIPRFMSKTEETLTGADRGTAYHRVFQLFDYSCAGSREEVEHQLTKMLEEGKLTQEMFDCILPEDFVRFAGSGLGERMRSAARKNRLYREQPFTMSIPASKKNAAYSDCDSILVQGIIDAFFYEEDEIILVDYKTDKVYRIGELVKRYQKQLDYYSQVLERTTGKKVAERILYSVTLGKAIRC